MEVAQLIQLLRYRWKLLLFTALLLPAAALGYRIWSPGSFKAVASVIVDPRGINPVSGAATQESMAQEAVLGTYANIARSEGTARLVFSQLPPDLRSVMQDQWLGSHVSSDKGFDTWAARQLMRRVDIRAGGQSSRVLDISVSDRDGARAAQFANAYASSLIQFSRDMRISAARKDADYFQEQAASFRAQTEEAEGRLAAFQRRHGIASMNDGADVEIAKLAALNSQTIASQDLSYDSSSRARQASSGSTTDILSNPLVQSLGAAAAEKEARLRQLSARLGANHPDLITAQAQADQARQALAIESRNVAASLASSSSAAASRAAALRADTEKQQRRVVEMTALRVELGSLSKEVQQKQKLYETALLRSAETGLEAGSQRADLHLLAEALPPDAPSGPGLALVMPLALFAGLLLGVLVAVCAQSLRPRIYHLSDLEAIGIPVLQVLPLGKSAPGLDYRYARLQQ